MPTYELRYKKSITPTTTYKVIRLLRNVEGEEPKNLNATDSQALGYPLDKKVNVSKNKSLFIVQNELSQSFYKDLLKLHEMVISLIIDLPATTLFTYREAYLHYIDLELRSRSDEFIRELLSDEQIQQIEAAFKYAEEQRFLSYIRHTEQRVVANTIQEDYVAPTLK